MKICIDAGHNDRGHDTGANGRKSREQDITYGIASVLRDILTAKGFEVKMTREKQSDCLGTSLHSSLAERVNISNSFGAEYFVSIHCNSASDPNAKGTETYVCAFGGTAEKLAKKIQSHLVSSLGTMDRGVKTGNFQVIRDTDCPAVLVETAFLSNPSEEELLLKKQQEFAQAIAEGLFEQVGYKKEEKKVTENTIAAYNGKRVSAKMIDNVNYIKARDAAELFDKDIEWLEGERTVLLKDKAESTPPPAEETTYHIEGTTHILEIDPRKIWCAETQCSTKDIPYDNFVNSIFFMNQRDGTVYPQGIMVNAGKVLCNNPTHGLPVSTLIVRGWNEVEMKKTADITQEQDVWFAVSGYSIYPEITASEEGFTGKFSDVLREANRPIIGYRKRDNKIIVAVRANSSAERARQTAQNLGLDFALSLDGGGSTTLKVNGKDIFSGDGRRIFGGIGW